MPTSPLQASGLLFDRQLIKERRNRVATSFSSHAFLKECAVQDLANRLRLIRRSFQHCIDLGGHTGQLATFLRGIPLITTDLS